MLNTVVHGTPADKPPLLIVHGLYGSAKNWGVIARRLSDARQVIAVDMRNHGESFWETSHGYADMAADLAQVIEAHGGRTDVVGHSMGGKASMMLALQHPDLVRRLVVADIAPVAYGHTQVQFIHAMRDLDLSGIERRTEADALLAETVQEPATRDFLLQSLDLKQRRWRLNLDVLEAAMPGIVGWPNPKGEAPHPALFLSGGASPYVQPEARPEIRRLFPKARFAKLPGAGHWLHAEKPREFEATVRAFLDARDSGDPA